MTMLVGDWRSGVVHTVDARELLHQMSTDQVCLCKIVALNLNGKQVEYQSLRNQIFIFVRCGCAPAVMFHAIKGPTEKYTASRLVAAQSRTSSGHRKIGWHAVCFITGTSEHPGAFQMTFNT
eukprot:6189015-Pleurochrysis_carterae.AAC.3